MIGDWFDGPTVEPIIFPENRKLALLFGINDYPSYENDLNGCRPDILHREEIIKTYFPDVTVAKFLDRQVTRERMEETVTTAISKLHPGDSVILSFDSCFSQGATRLMGLVGNDDRIRYLRPRFAPRSFPQRPIVRKQLAKGDDPEKMLWTAISACGERQTSADAYVKGYGHTGIFHYYDLQVMRPNLTWAQANAEVKKYLPSSNFDQVPSITGPSWMVNRVPFDVPTLYIDYSGHGTYDYDRNGDEADGYDEALFLYDGVLLDDTINSWLQKIPA